MDETKKGYSAETAMVKTFVDMVKAHQRGDIESRDTLLERLHDQFGITLHFADELVSRDEVAK